MKKNKIITDANDLIEGNSLCIKPFPGQLRKINEELPDSAQKQEVAKEELMWRRRQLQSWMQEKEIRRLKSESTHEKRSLKT